MELFLVDWAALNHSKVMKHFSETDCVSLRRTPLLHHVTVAFRIGEVTLLLISFFFHKRADVNHSQCSLFLTVPKIRLKYTCPLKAFEGQRQTSEEAL